MKKACLILILFLVFIGHVSIVFASVVIKSPPIAGLSAYWTFDGNKLNWISDTALDSSGNGNTGVLMNMSTSTSLIPGKVGQALQFDGVSSSVGLASNPLSSMNNPNSICAWAKTTDLSSESGLYNQTIIDLFTNNSNGVRMGNVYNSGIFFVMYKAGGNLYGAQSNNQVFNNNAWAQVCYVWDGGGITLYANGSAIATTTSSDSVGTPSTIGARNNGGDGTWKGPLDDIRVYNRALTADEVKRLYQSGAATIGKVPSGKAKIDVASASFLNNGLIGYWSFDGKTMNWKANTVADLSGNGLIGTLENMSTTTSPVMGKIGQALSFDGSTNYVDIPDPLYLTDDLPDFTVSAWFNTSAAPYDACGSPIVIKTSSDICGGTGWMITIGGSGTFSPTGSVAAFIQGPTAAYWSGENTSAAYNDGKWHHVAMIVTGGNAIALYVDGSTSDTNSDNGPSVGSYSNGSDIRIGRTQGGANEFFDGSIDDVRVYDRALSASEVRQLYLMGK